MRTQQGRQRGRPPIEAPGRVSTPPGEVGVRWQESPPDPGGDRRPGKKNKAVEKHGEEGWGKYPERVVVKTWWTYL